MINIKGIIGQRIFKYDEWFVWFFLNCVKFSLFNPYPFSFIWHQVIIKYILPNLISVDCHWIESEFFVVHKIVGNSDGVFVAETTWSDEELLLIFSHQFFLRPCIWILIQFFRFFEIRIQKIVAYWIHAFRWFIAWLVLFVVDNT